MDFVMVLWEKVIWNHFAQRAPRFTGLPGRKTSSSLSLAKKCYFQTFQLKLLTLIFISVILEKTIRIPRSFSVKAGSILKGLLSKNPLERLGCHKNSGFMEILTHPFFKTIYWDAVSHFWRHICIKYIVFAR